MEGTPNLMSVLLSQSLAERVPERVCHQHAEDQSLAHSTGPGNTSDVAFLTTTPRRLGEITRWGGGRRGASLFPL